MMLGIFFGFPLAKCDVFSDKPWFQNEMNYPKNGGDDDILRWQSGLKKIKTKNYWTWFQNEMNYPKNEVDDDILRWQSGLKKIKTKNYWT